MKNTLLRKLSRKFLRCLLSLALCFALLTSGLLFTGCEPNMDDQTTVYKPVLYLYPELSSEISVRLDLNGEFLVTEPLYNDGWLVDADPDGTLFAADGKSYPYLFWEASLAYHPDRSVGYCVAGGEASAFLADMLPKWGLNEAEAAEFAEYWLPIMEANAYQLVIFNDPNYLAAAVYYINPAPDKLIRLFMTLIPVDAPVEIAEPVPPAAEEIARKGFTAVEWGGTVVK